MKDNERKIDVKELAKEIAGLIKDEIVATYTEQESALEIRFLNGQVFRVSVEEIG